MKLTLQIQEGSDKFMFLWIETSDVCVFVPVPDSSAQVHFSLDVFEALETNPVHFLLHNAVASMTELQATPNLGDAKLDQAMGTVMTAYTAYIAECSAWLSRCLSASSAVADVLQFLDVRLPPS